MWLVAAEAAVVHAVGQVHAQRFSVGQRDTHAVCEVNTGVTSYQTMDSVVGPHPASTAVSMIVGNENRQPHTQAAMDARVGCAPVSLVSTFDEEDVYSLDVFVQSISLPIDHVSDGLIPGSQAKFAAAFHFLDYQPIVFSATTTATSGAQHSGSAVAMKFVKVQKGQSCYFRSTWPVLRSQIESNPLHICLLYTSPSPRDRG